MDKHHIAQKQINLFQTRSSRMNVALWLDRNKQTNASSKLTNQQTCIAHLGQLFSNVRAYPCPWLFVCLFVFDHFLQLYDLFVANSFKPFFCCKLLIIFKSTPRLIRCKIKPNWSVTLLLHFILSEAHETTCLYWRGADKIPIFVWDSQPAQCACLYFKKNQQIMTLPPLSNTSGQNIDPSNFLQKICWTIFPILLLLLSVGLGNFAWIQLKLKTLKRHLRGD